MNRVFSTFIVTLVILSGLMAITVMTVAETSQRGGTVVLSYKGNTVPDPDPQLARNVGAETVALMMADPLVRWEEGAVVPVLATSWEMAPDGMSYTFHLRKGVKFHNGVPLTAEAVELNIERIMNPDNAMPAAGRVANVASVEALDGLTLCVNMEKVDPDFPAKMEGVYIIEPGSLEGRDEGDAVAGSGAFRLVADEYVRDQQMVLEKFPDYWGGEPYLDRVVVRLIPDEATAVIELEQGTIDFMEFALSKDVARLEAAGYQPFIFGFINWANVAINLETVTDVALRKAMCYALDSQAIIDGVYAGLGKVQKTLGYPGSWLENTEVGYPYDPEEAKRILDEAGYVDTDGDGIREMNGKNIDLHFPTRSQDEWMRATQLIQQMYLDVGIGTHITIAERMPFYDGVRAGDYDIAWWLQNATPTPPIALYSWDSREYWSMHQQEQPVFQALIEAAESKTDQEKRAVLYKEIQKIFYEQAYGALGMWVKQVHIAAPTLHGMKVGPIGTAYNSHLWWTEAG